jgi:hypothetical protein
LESAFLLAPSDFRPEMVFSVQGSGSLAAVALGQPVAAATSPSLSISLLAPAAGAAVPRGPSSPVFRWQISSPQPLDSQYTEALELSTDSSFTFGVAAEGFPCGLSGTGCATSYQWKQTNYWYLESDGCNGIPPKGDCKNGLSVSGVVYWRVWLRGPDGFVYSPVRTFKLGIGADRQPPSVYAKPGGGRAGALSFFNYLVSDNSGQTRERLQLLAGGQVVFSGFGDWSAVRQGWPAQFQVHLPPTLQHGVYQWCVTGYDRAGNHATDCARYTVN